MRLSNPICLYPRDEGGIKEKSLFPVVVGTLILPSGRSEGRGGNDVSTASIELKKKWMGTDVETGVVYWWGFFFLDDREFDFHVGILSRTSFSKSFSAMVKSDELN